MQLGLGIARCRRVLNSHSQALQFGQSVNDSFTGSQSHIDDRLTALQRLFDGVLSAHFRTLRGRNGKDCTVILGRRNLQARIHTVLGGFQRTVGAVQGLQGDKRTAVGVDRVGHSGLLSSVKHCRFGSRSILLRSDGRGDQDRERGFCPLPSPKD